MRSVLVSLHPLSGRSRRRRRRKPLLWPFAGFYPLRTGFPCRSIDGFSIGSPTPSPPPVGRWNNSLARRHFFPSPREGIKGWAIENHRLLQERAPTYTARTARLIHPHRRSIEDLRTPITDLQPGTSFAPAPTTLPNERTSFPRRLPSFPRDRPSFARDDLSSQRDDPSLRPADTSIRFVPATCPSVPTSIASVRTMITNHVAKGQ